ncbi:MAG: S8 family serine peptidase [Candidatus Marinimicrobia bacterium]|nr:S8 family serine peptidase [Candidatus Neomarinimicrobiota bacterium]
MIRRTYSLVIIILILLNIQLNASGINEKKLNIKTAFWKGKYVKYIPHQIAVKIKPDASKKEIKELFREKNIIEIVPVDKWGWFLAGINKEIDEISFINELLSNPIVICAELNNFVTAGFEPDDPYFDGTSPATYAHQWALKNTGQTPPSGTIGADIDIINAWDITKGDTSVIIAVLDSGIPMENGVLSHPDLNNSQKILLGDDFTPLIYSNVEDETVTDHWGHGTHVTGIIAAEANNDTGIAGIAHGCKIIVMQVFEDEGGFGSSYLFKLGVDSVVNYKINHPNTNCIINFSGNSGNQTYVTDALDNAEEYEVLIVSIAGNGFSDPVEYPAKFSEDYSNIIAVSSVDADGVFSAFSNKGSQICVAAPGGYGGVYVNNIMYYNTTSNYGKNIFSTTPNYNFNMQSSTDVTTSYGYLDGTSMAAPVVSAIAGLLLSINSDLTPSQVRNIIETTADDDDAGDGFDNYYGHGKINAYKALKYTLENYGGTLTQNITVSSGRTLDIKTGTTVNLNSYTFTSSGGTIIVENGATINPYICLKNGSAIKGLYSTLSSALSAASNGETIEFGATTTLTGDVTIPSGVTLTINSDASITMRGNKITTTSGTINVNYDADINPFIVHRDHSDDIIGLYPNIDDAFSAVSAAADQTVEINSAVSVSSDDIIVPFETTLEIMDKANLSIDYPYTITTNGGSIVLSGSPTINPDIRALNSGTIQGLYHSISDAMSQGTTVQARGGTHTFADHYTIASGKLLGLYDEAEIKFPSGKYLYVNGGLYCDEATFTSTSGTWGGIKYQSGFGTLNEATITNATYGVYCNSASPTIEYSDISNCTYGVYNSGGSPDIYNSSINGGTYGVYNYNGSYYNTIAGNMISSTYGIYSYASLSLIRNNEITSSTIGLYCDNNSSPELLSGGNYFHGNFVIFGVFADNNSSPSMGVDYCSVGGNHSFVYNNLDIALVSAGTNCHIWAQNNWWGTSSPNAGMFGGNVEWDPWLTSMPQYTMQLSPENELFEESFKLSSVAPDDGGEDLITYYDDTWSLEQKIRFLRYLVNNDEVLGVPALCKDIIETYPYSQEAFTALNIIYQITKKRDIKKDIDKGSLKTYLMDFEEKKGNKMLNGSALLMLAGLEKKEGLSRIDVVYSENKNNYLGEYALYQKYMYYFHEEEDSLQAKKVLALMDEVYPDSRVTYEAHLLLGDEVITPGEFYSQLQKNNEAEQIEFTSTDIDEILPEEYALSTAYPNPFNPSTTIEFALPVQSDVECSIYNVSGNLIKEYSLNQNAGIHSIVWDGSNVSSGIYLIKFTAESQDGAETFVDYQKVTLLK